MRFEQIHDGLVVDGELLMLQGGFERQYLLNAIGGAHVEMVRTIGTDILQRLCLFPIDGSFAAGTFQPQPIGDRSFLKCDVINMR